MNQDSANDRRALLQEALNALDAWVDERYRRILKHGKKDDNHLNNTIAFYLYGRSFFLKDRPVEKVTKLSLKDTSG